MKNLLQKKSIKLLSVIFLLLLSGRIYLKSQATSFSWNQTGWLGGQSGTTATHSQDANGTWNKYSAKDANLNINGSGDAEIAKANNWQETADADFNSNTSKDATLAVSGNSIKLLKPNGAACNAGTECQTNTCAANICADSFLCGNSTVTKDSVTYGTVTGADGRCWLDRNLGATRVATAYNDTQAYGWYFQWGRGVDGHQIPTSGTTTTISSTDAPGHANFIKGSTDWRSPVNNALWQGTSGTNNPCPTGWRLPTLDEWTSLVNSAGITNYTTAYNSSLKLTAAGMRYYDASLIHQGAYGLYWAVRSGVTSDAPTFIFYSSAVELRDAPFRAYGFSVRCIKN